MARGAERVQALVIGGGVVGCAVLRELARHGIGALLVEAEPDVCEGTSKANSAIVHTGFDARPGTLEATMLRRAAALWPALIDELGVPYLETGALVLALSPAEAERLASETRPNAEALGVATELLDRAALRALAPYVTDQAVAALLVPGEGVIDPFWLTRGYAEAALAAGARLVLSRRVVGLAVGDDGVAVELDDGSRLWAEQVFNCAGLWADEVARLAGDDSFALSPRKGQFLVSEEPFGVEQIVLPLPGPMGKGVLVTPIVFGGVLLGPTAEDLRDKHDRGVDAAARARILEGCRRLVPAVEAMVPIRQFAGLRAVSSTGDYILRPSTRGDRLFHVAGIRSTGISTSPALAEHVVARAAERRGWRLRPGSPAGLSTGWDAPTSRPQSAAGAAFVEQSGEVVCLCRSISRGEVLAALRSPSTPATLDALKRRCGVTFGDCQGNLCTVEVALLAAAERGQPPSSMLKHRLGSWLFVPGPEFGGRNSGFGIRGSNSQFPIPNSEPADLPSGVAELVVIGGGLAGIGCALAAHAVGLRPLVLERAERLGGALRACLRSIGSAAEREALAQAEHLAERGEIGLWLGATAIGLLPGEQGWRLMVQGARGTGELVAQQVVVASGGYVQPREHLPIAGPRGSGVVTADLVHRALDRGLLPGRVAVVVGSGRYARATAERLGAAGAEVRAHLGGAEAPLRVEAVRGDRRLEAVRIGDRWCEADLLVLAHRLLPAAFLLRGAGLLDGRPGIPVPVDGRGATPLEGVWAVGTCVAPDVDHVASLEAGMRLGKLVAERRA